MRIDVVSLFPALFAPVLGTSILGRAAERGVVSYHLHDIRDWSDDRHRKVDERPFGGGPGMVMTCQPLFDCVQSVEAMDPRTARRVLLTPQGRPLDQPLVEELAREERLLLIAGHYEGIDERVIERLDPLEVSIGDYVLSGGELPAMVLIDTVVRLQPGALGHEDSAEIESFAPAPEPPRAPGRRRVEDDFTGRRLLDCPHYTRPRVWKDRAVPEVLLSGDHQAIAGWRRQQMIARTRARRPDLLPRTELRPARDP